MISLSRCALLENDQRPVAVHAGQTMDGSRFHADVAGHAAAFKQQSQQSYALYYDAAYPFAVIFYALLHAGKQIWIAGNNRPAHADRLTGEGCRLLGDWPGRQIAPATPAEMPLKLEALDLGKAQLIIYTSGSSGQPKAIAKTLLQLQLEVEVLEQLWGTLLGQATVVATVSHQHIYGLLFRLLWPLAAGRCFYSRQFLSPEAMLNAVGITPACWIASPAHLKRLDDLSPWHDIARLSAVFSSGGALTLEVARQFERCSGRRIVEIYGSSETGGIAWRYSAAESSWTPFPGIRLSATGEEGLCLLHSPFLSNEAPYPLTDRIQLREQGGFALLGRLDRIVKVEEKRLSLDQLENKLSESSYVQQAHSLLLTDRRDLVAAVIVLTKDGKILLQQQGRTALIKQLKKQLMQEFETVVLPRKWLFINTLPLTIQGKIDNVLLQRLLKLDSAIFPRLLGCHLEESKVTLEFRIQAELVYFQGHFPGQPILPGVAQLAWAERYGKILFAIEQPFLTMETIKFKKIIQPKALITMTLAWDAVSGKLYFEFCSSTASHSSGRMVYGARL